MEITSLIIAIVSLTWGAFTFWFYDRKTKKQDEKINSYTLAKIEEEKVEGKKALVEANLISKGKGNYTLKIFNKGKSEARNIRVEYVEKGSNYNVMDFDVFPHSHLSPNNDHIDLNAISCGANKMNFALIWDDDFAKDRKNDKSLTF